MKLTFLSDTHLREPELLGGDILFHCGDLSENGFRIEVLKAMNYLHEQLDKYKHVVFIPGNHDLWIERHEDAFKRACESAGIIGLINEGVELEGLKIWGSPVTREHHQWAYNKNETDRRYLWDRIPEGLDVLLTHGPPYGILDKTSKDENIGCIPLLERVLEVKPRIHAFGHVHEDKGRIIQEGIEFINCATSVVDLELKWIN